MQVLSLSHAPPRIAYHPSAMIETANVQLADFLANTGVITTEQAEDYKARVIADFWPLGRILIDRKTITAQQLLKLLQAQTDEPWTQLGELAVHAGYCTHEQLLEALADQRERCPHILEIAINDGAADTLDLIRGAAAYIRHTEHLLSAREAAHAHSFRL